MNRVVLLFTMVIAFCNQSAAQLNMQFRSQLPYGAGNELSNIGGFMDTLGNEYALVGCQTGLSIVDVTNPTAPVQKFLVAGTNSFWREVKVWGRYAYVTTEGCCNGLQIIDLRNLPATVTSKYWTGTGAAAGLVRRLHSLHIDDGYAYLNGGNSSTGSLFGGASLIVSLADPWNPVYMSNTSLSYTGNNRYVHDCYVRNDTLWGAHIYGGFFSVINVANKSAPSAIVLSQTTPNAFTHNAWLNTSGSRTLFTTDETSNSFMASYDVSDLSNITLLDKVQLNPGSGAIVHNTHIKNNYAIVSWYKEGVAIVDVARPDNLIITGYYDTYPQATGNGFNGCWGVYPFLPSGNIVASDINNGLFVLTPTYVRGCYLEGSIRDACTNNGIPNVTVTINGANITKASKITGVYKTGTPVSGNYSVTFSKSGYQSKTILNVALNNGIVSILDVSLSPVNAVTIANGVVSNVNCNGALSGSVNVTASGGTLPQTWLWSNGATTEDISMVAAGNYNVTVTDGAGCKSSANYTITQPAPIQISFSSTPVSCNNANDGSITAMISGGNSPFSFNWSFVSTPMQSSVGSKTIFFQQSPLKLLVNDTTSISNLSAGTYNLTITDSNGCLVSAQYSLTTPPNPCYVSLNLKLFIQGFYHSPAYMHAVANPVSYPGVCDTIQVALHQNHTPFAMQYKMAALSDTDGNSQIIFPSSAWMNNYFIVVKHRNSLETWSKYPVQFGENNFYDFTVNPGPVLNSLLLK